VLAFVVFDGLARVPLARPSLPRAVAAVLVAAPILRGTLALVADTVANCSLDLTVWPLLPRSAAQFALQLALVMVVGAGALAMAAVLSLAGPLPATRAGRAALLGVMAVSAPLAVWLCPGPVSDLPVPPAILIFAAAAVAGLGLRGQR